MARRKDKRWMQKAVENPGSYREQLKRLGVIKGDEKIPVTLSRKIKNTEIGKTVKWKGKKIKVTPLLKKRANLHVIFHEHRRNRKRKKR